MAALTIKARFFSESISLLIKSLEFSWLSKCKKVINNTTLKLEMKAFDQLGYCYYMLGDVQKAGYYHEK